jgi:hypothetical protein
MQCFRNLKNISPQLPVFVPMLTVIQLANSKIQNAFLYPVLAMFRHDCPLAVKPASTSWRLLLKQTWKDSLPTGMLLAAASVLVVSLSSSEFPEALITLCNIASTVVTL